MYSIDICVQLARMWGSVHPPGHAVCNVVDVRIGCAAAVVQVVLVNETRVVVSCRGIDITVHVDTLIKS